MPYFKDIDGSDSMVTYQYVSKTTATTDVNIFAYVPSGPLRVSPTQFAEVGIHTLNVVLWDYATDGSGKTFTPWTINVTNTAPRFNSPILPNATV